MRSDRGLSKNNQIVTVGCKFMDHIKALQGISLNNYRYFQIKFEISCVFLGAWVGGWVGGSRL